MRNVFINLILSLILLSTVSSTARAQPENTTCPAGTKEALEKAKIPLKIEPFCENRRGKEFPLSDSKIIPVVYDQIRTDVIDFQAVPVLFLSSGETYVLPKWFMRDDSLKKYVTQSSYTPFYDESWSNLTIDNFTDQKIVKKENAYCIEYSFKYPFQGQVDQCPNLSLPLTLGRPEEAYSVSGEVGYASGAYTWKEALEKVITECQKYNEAKCKFQLGWDWSKGFPWGWNGPSANTLIKVENDPEQKVNYYLFNVRTYRGQEDQLLVQVFSDGEVRSKKIFDGQSTWPKDLWAMAECFDLDKLNSTQKEECKKFDQEPPQKKKSKSLPFLPLPVPKD